MSDPLNIPHFIALVVSNELPVEDVKVWFRLASDLLPDGVRSTVQVVSPGEGLVPVPVVCREAKDGFRYYIPLARNLLECEAEPIVQKLSRRLNCDFDLIVSKADVEDKPADISIKIQSDKYDAICAAFAKKQHEQWVSERLARGWRYATEMSMINKTSPMLRSWDELPNELRQIDYEHPQTLVDMLNDQGYAVVRKEELAAILSLASRTP